MVKRTHGKRNWESLPVLRPHASCRGFTLTELAVVGLIAVILGTLIWVGVSKVLRNRRVAMVKTELAALELAIEAYKQKFGYYPPDNPGNTQHHQLYYELRGTLLEKPVTSPPWSPFPARPTWPLAVQSWPDFYHAGNLPDKHPIGLSRFTAAFGREAANSALIPTGTYAHTDTIKRQARPTGAFHDICPSCTHVVPRLRAPLIMRITCANPGCGLTFNSMAPLLTREGGNKNAFRPADFAKFKIQNFIPTWKNDQWITLNNGTWQHCTFLKVPVALSGNETNLWHYRATKPEHNTKGFDLWAEFGAEDAKQIIGNWKEK